MDLTPPDDGGLLLPFQRIEGWLDDAEADALLDFALRSEDRLEASRVVYNGAPTHNPNLRSSLRTRDLGAFSDRLTALALEAAPPLTAALGMQPFTPEKVEIELVAHGDGAFFSRHIDTFVMRNQLPTTRVVTMVLYLNRRPRAYSGGALRLYAIGGDRYVDLAADHNVLAAFPAFAPHSVERIDCPGDAFCDRRFAVNMWLHS